jgi:hypothetical protein
MLSAVDGGVQEIEARPSPKLATTSEGAGGRAETKRAEPRTKSNTTFISDKGKGTKQKIQEERRLTSHDSGCSDEREQKKSLGKVNVLHNSKRETPKEKDDREETNTHKNLSSKFVALPCLLNRSSSLSLVSSLFSLNSTIISSV